MTKKKNAAEKRREMEQLRLESRRAKEQQKDVNRDNAIKSDRVHEKTAKLSKKSVHQPLTIRIETLSPLHLGSGHADIHVDADVVQDDVGLPYFPAKRLKGLLYESGLEVAEMAEASGLPLFDKVALDTLFQRGCTGDTQLVMHNLYLENYAELHADLKYLEERYPSVFRPTDILDCYACLRWQTRIDRASGVAEETSLRNMRVIGKGTTFRGEIRFIGGDMDGLKILALAVRNLAWCGGKRTRGFGRIGCSLEQGGKDILTPLLEEALNPAGKKGGRP